MTYIVCFFLLLLAILGYFKIAHRYRIVDKPNVRSSHTYITIRGGGIVFLLSILLAGGLQPYYWLPVLGALVIGAISLLDDHITLSSKLRLFFHLLSVSLLFMELGLWVAPMTYPWWIMVILYIWAIGVINAYNFMDGINGITGLYSMVLLAGLQYVNLRESPFIEPELIWLPMIACGIFLFYNLRRKAKCFAGDVGSITIAYWIVYLLMKLIFISGDLSYVLFLSLYGVDSVMTILHRLYLRQNIFHAHRMHFYQVLVNEKGFPHVSVAFTYAVLQAGIVALILFSGLSFWSLALLSLVPLLILYSFKFKWVVVNRMRAS